MRSFRNLSRHLLATGLAGLMLACSSTPTYNPTVFPFEIDQARVDQGDIKTVVITHVNLGLSSRTYLEKEAPRIDAMVSAYLKKNGLKVLPQRDFEQRWNTAVRSYGNPVDPTSGKVNMKTFSQIMTTIRDEMRGTGLDAFIFTDLVELQTSFSGGLQHVARWDGVTRKPTIQGPGDGVSADFDWAMLLDVASLQVSIYDMELKRVFLGRGGIDATQAIDSRSSKGRYIRRRDILENETSINEGIELAFYPFIKTENWPGNP
ncbi:MAG: hypothetical protein OEW92_07950 [Gammaproteobacteria bacterium]|jgi:hypothetical protein|nr:hypothetical protein [Gammaproteobacteria bacterium]MDH5172335.1 hypothetical protein [Gammaproteobacteria bacterium]